MSDSVRPHRRKPTRLPVPGILQARTLEWVAISFSSVSFYCTANWISYTYVYISPLFGFPFRKSPQNIEFPVLYSMFSLVIYFIDSINSVQASLMAQWLRICLPVQEMRNWSLGQEDPLEKEMATHFSILACEIPWTEEPGWL